MERGDLRAVILTEVCIAVVISGLVAVAYWLKAKYLPGPTYFIAALGAVTSAVLATEIARRYATAGMKGRFRIGYFVPGVLSGALTFLLSTGFTISLLGS